MKNFLSIRKKRIVIAILTIILLGSCGGVFSKVKKSNYPTPVQEDPYLNLTLLVAFGKDVSYNEINVENDCIKIGAKDIKAFFDYGTKRNEEIPVIVENGTLNEGDNLVRLSIKAVKDKYQEWQHVVTVFRKKIDPELKLVNMIIHEGYSTRIDDGIDITHGSYTVGYGVTKINPENIWAAFRPVNDDKGFASVIPLVFENTKLAVGNNKIKISIPAVKGKYKAFSMDLTVIRNKLPDNSLISITPPKAGIIGSAANKADFPFLCDHCIPCILIEHFQGVFVEGRTVILSPFNMAETETTYKLWKEVYDWATDASRGTNKYTFANHGKMGGYSTPSPYLTPHTELEPVTDISWYDCVVWCNAYTEKRYGSDAECVYRKSKVDNSVLRDATELVNTYEDPYFDKTKKGFRLPTEAEWEYAARVQSDGTLCPLTYLSGAMGNCLENSQFLNYAAWCGSFYIKTHEVKCKAKNAIGLYDMSGNVHEFCWDARDYDTSVDTGVETNPAPHHGYVILRGGMYYDGVVGCLVGRIRLCGLRKHSHDYVSGFRICQYQ